MPVTVENQDVLLMSLSGLESLDIEEDVVVNSSGLSRGDRLRDERLGWLRGLVRLDNAILGIDLADERQVLVVANHDSQVLARRRMRCKAWDMDKALWWARQVARKQGFADVMGGASRPGIVGGFSISWPPPRRCRWCVCRRCWSGGLVKLRTTPAIRPTIKTPC